ncbi:MAG: hypothetical protein WBA77_05545 [Microcoleaceae cyanobacterium]
MQPDLVGLEISIGEIKGLTGVNVKHVYRPPQFKTFLQEGIKTLVTIALVVLSYLILAFIFLSYRQILLIIHSCLGIGLLLEDGYKMILSTKHQNLLRILDDIDRYNAIIKTIDLNDQLAELGNSQIKLNDREKVIAALKLIREDLVRAMKTEKILRKNQKFLTEHEDLFVTNLTALTGLQISDRATQQGRLLNEALEIATRVQAELKQLQGERLKQKRKPKP